MFEKSTVFAALMAALLLSSCPALAGEGRVDQAENLEIEQGSFEFELQSIFVPRSNGEQGEWKFAPTIEYGLSDRLSIGLEIEFEKEADEKLGFSEIGVQAKLVAISPDDAPVGLGIQTSVIFDRSGNIGSETYFIADHVGDKIHLTGNLILTAEPGDWSSLSTSYVGRFDHVIDDNLSLGVETGGEFTGEAKGRHWVGPVLSAASEEGALIPSFELSVFAPLTRETPAVQFRLELDWEF